MMYLTLFTVNISHDYYPDSRCPDFVLDPTEETLAILKGHRLVAKRQIDGLSVLVPVVEAGPNDQWTPLIPIADQQKFSFFLYLKTPDFLNFTDLKILDFFNAKEADSPKSDDYFNWYPILHHQGLIYYSNSPTSGNEPDRLHIIKCLWKNLPKPVTKRSPTHLLYGLIEIVYQHTSLSNDLQNPKYEIAFTAAKKKWQYYIITNSTSNGNNAWAIKSKEEKSLLKFVEMKADDKDQVVKAIKRQFPGNHIHITLFESKDRIACRKVGRKGIQLLKNNEKSAWIEHLPNPSPSSSPEKAFHVINTLKTV